MEQAVEVLQEFSQDERAYHTYQSRMDAIRQEITIQDLLKEGKEAKKLLEQQTEELLLEKQEAEKGKEKERKAKEKAEQKEREARAEVEHLKKLLQEKSN